MNNKLRWVSWIGMIGFISCLVLEPLVFAQEKEAETTQETKATQESAGNRMLKRASHGISNMVYGPLEIPYQMKAEIKRSDPVRGFFPGLVKGVGWSIARNAVGLFEVLTFFREDEPALPEFDTEWLYA